MGEPDGKQDKKQWWKEIKATKEQDMISEVWSVLVRIKVYNLGCDMQSLWSRQLATHLSAQHTSLEPYQEPIMPAMKRPASLLPTATKSSTTTSALAADIASQVESLSASEQRLGFQKLKRALAQSSEAATKWQAITDLPSRGHDKNKKKKALLFSYLHAQAKDKGESFGPSFWSTLKEVVGEEEDSQKGQWISRGRLEQLIGFAEASERIEGDELDTKEDKNGRTLYFYEEHHHDLRALKRTKTGTSSRKGIAKGADWASRYQLWWVASFSWGHGHDT